MCSHTGMHNVIFSMGVSLDGYIAGPDGEIDWSAPDEKLHRFHNELVETRTFGPRVTYLRYRRAARARTSAG
jgi:dihydrofolate reductase